MSSIADNIIESLRRRGRSNVRAAYLEGGPSPEDALRGMIADGVDSVAVFPLALSEGELTVRRMPASIGMPDNSCSYTYVDGRNLTIRFMTALGQDPAVLEAIVASALLAGAGPGTPVLEIARGSSLSGCRRTMARLAEMLAASGTGPVSTVSTTHSDASISDALSGIVGDGPVVVLPVMLSDALLHGRLQSGIGLEEDAREGVVRIGGRDIRVRIAEPIGMSEAVVRSIESRIPPGWRRPQCRVAC